MAPHSSALAWRIPWMEEPGGLQSMGSLRVRHDRATSLSPFIFMHWRRKWQPTPVFLPRESQVWRSLVGCHLWSCTESDMTEVIQQQQTVFCLCVCLLLINQAKWIQCLQRQRECTQPKHPLKYIYIYTYIYMHIIYYLKLFCDDLISNN